MTRSPMVQRLIAAGLNDVDMNDRGERRGSLAAYGHGLKAVEAALQAWGVVDRYLLNPGPSGQPPEPSYHSGPHYMLKFQDGLWRYASFGGISGPPWIYCPPEGFAGKTGKEAELRRQIRLQQANVDSLKNQYTAAVTELGKLRWALNQETESVEPSADESE